MTNIAIVPREMARTAEELESLRTEIDAVPYWWHRIDLGDGVVTPGLKGLEGSGTGSDTPYDFAAEAAALRLPKLRGKSVLDIGAWDGYYSFAAEAAGASRVVSLDYFVWQHPEFGGGRGYDIAHRELGSKAEKYPANFLTCDLSPLGRFDVVFFLGVLYHLDEPYRAIERLFEVTDGTAVIETEAVYVPGHERRRLAEFFVGGELGGDVTNRWSPNLAALTGMCQQAGFSRIDVVQGPRKAAPGIALLRRGVYRYRAMIHATR